MHGGEVWEGITWILDLLPHYPAEALSTVSSYLVANWQDLPDWVITGLGDAMGLIRARYLEAEPTRSTLLALSPRDFEFLVGALYRRLGYRVAVTKVTRDGGKDVIAQKDAAGLRELVLVSAKLHQDDV